jgi:hypothetical protein
MKLTKYSVAMLTYKLEEAISCFDILSKCINSEIFKL